MNSKHPIDNRLRCVGATVAIAIAALHLCFLSHHSLRNNEFITLRSIVLDWGDMIHERIVCNHVPGYFIIVKAWTGAVGHAEWAMRLPSALMTLAGLFGLWLLGRRMLGERWGLAAPALAGFTQTFLFLSLNARMYGGVFMAAVFSLYGALVYLESGSRRGLATMIAAGIFGAALQPLSLLTTASLCVYAVIERRWRWTGRRSVFVMGALAPVLALTPMLVWWLGNQDKVGGGNPFNGFQLRSALRQLIVIAFGDGDYLGTGDVKYVGLIACVAAWIALARWRRSGDRTPGEPILSMRDAAKLLAVWVALPALVIVAAGVKSTSQLVNDWRYYVVCAPAIELTLAWTLMQVWARNRRAAWALGAAWALVCATHTVSFLTHPDSGLRETAHYLLEHRPPSEPLAASDVRARSLAFDYYGLAGGLIEKPEDVRSDSEIVAWLLETGRESGRVWIVFYHSLRRDRVLKTLKKHPEHFTPHGKMFVSGWTGVQCFSVHDAPEQDRPVSSTASKTHFLLSSAPGLVHNSNKRSKACAISS